MVDRESGKPINFLDVGVPAHLAFYRACIAAVSEQAILAIRESAQIGRRMERTPNGRREKRANAVGPDYAARLMRRPATDSN